MPPGLGDTPRSWEHGPRAPPPEPDSPASALRKERGALTEAVTRLTSHVAMKDVLRCELLGQGFGFE